MMGIRIQGGHDVPRRDVARRFSGCVMLWRLIKSTGTNDRMGINVRLLENPDVLANIKILRFDGAKTWSDVGTCTLKEPWW